MACSMCGGLGFLPNWMDAPGHPRCACGRRSVRQSGECMLGHPPIPCPRCGSEALQVVRGVGADLGRPPFATPGPPFCKCGWAIPGQINLDVRGSVTSMRMQCPYCGEWVSSNPPEERRPFAVVGGTLSNRELIEKVRELVPAEREVPPVERKLRLVKPDGPLKYGCLDGDWHETRDDCPHCSPKECRECGARVHSQPVYGPSIIYVCEGCEPEFWHETMPGRPA